mmetsp:Transcript_16038/g.27653  ORF Transcript_16038/g.27653 Transcript_16038/m.27653 type:complete len:213 (+) Transcript_16038:342-980(+)
MLCLSVPPPQLRLRPGGLLQAVFRCRQDCPVLLVGPLRKAHPRDFLCPSVQQGHHAPVQPLQKLLLLLGVRTLRGVLRKPPPVHPSRRHHLLFGRQPHHDPRLHPHRCRPHHVLGVRAAQLHHPHPATQPPAGRHSHPARPPRDPVLIHVVPQLPVRDPVLGRLHPHDPDHGWFSVHGCWRGPDGHLGGGQAPQLPQGVHWTQWHRALPTLS